LAKNNQSRNDNKRILVVDDEPDITQVLKRGLEQEGFLVDAYNDPRKALAEYEPDKYDLLLIDIRMPNMDGFQMYKEVMKRDAKVRVCFITAFEIYFDEFRRVFPKIRVSCFIPKPITISQLVKAIREELEREEDKVEIESRPQQDIHHHHHHSKR
jgi:two-component system, OmpR family, response regulator ChvI